MTEFERNAPGGPGDFARVALVRLLGPYATWGRRSDSGDHRFLSLRETEALLAFGDGKQVRVPLHEARRNGLADERAKGLRLSSRATPSRP
jgi:hypothetical protein